MVNQTVKIYVLKNPETGLIHYVGRSVTPNVRYRNHLHLARKNIHKNKKDAWICSLLDRKLKPLLEIIEVTTIEQATEREKFWIEELFKTCDLKNCRDYIENNYLFSVESRLKMSESHKGKTLTEEQKKKIGDKSRGNKYRLGQKQSKKEIENKSKIILQYTKDNIFIKEWPSGVEASKTLGLKQSLISATARGEKYRKSTGGFIWKYKNN
jgi:hypothetical protein